MTYVAGKDSDQLSLITVFAVCLNVGFILLWLIFHEYFQESEDKIQSLQSDISKAEQQQKLDNKQQPPGLTG